MAAAGPLTSKNRTDPAGAPGVEWVPIQTLVRDQPADGVKGKWDCERVLLLIEALFSIS
jgi:hypothetical protein